jgi:hypothetical protein
VKLQVADGAWEVGSYEATGTAHNITKLYTKMNVELDATLTRCYLWVEVAGMCL